MTLLKPFLLQPAAGDAELDYPGSEVRMLVQALAPGGEGVLVAPGAGYVVTHRAAGANFSLDVAAFQGIVVGDDVADQGSYLITNTAGAYNVVTPSAPASGTRTHRLIARVRDKRANGAYTTYDWILDLLQDGGSGEPAEPATALTLAHISIAAGQANVQDANISNAYNYLRTLRVMGPWSSLQASAGAWNNHDSWNSFSGGNWPAVSFTVPPSGKVRVTVSATVRPTTSQVASVGWSMSGADSVANAFNHAVRGGQQGAVGGSRTFLVTGLTPGATDTVTPSWHQTNATGATDDGDGQLIVEAVQ